MLSGLRTPTAIRFAPNGEVFVAEKSGRVLRFASLGDPRPELVADLSEQVYDYWDRGLLGLALDPGYPAQRRLYVLYTVDAPPGAIPPVWHDDCPTPPGGTDDGCVAGGRLSRLDLLPEPAARPKRCCWATPGASNSPATRSAAWPSARTARFTSERRRRRLLHYRRLRAARRRLARHAHPAQRLRRSAGGGRRAAAAAGRRRRRLRSQDLRSPGDATGWNGAILRLDPATGAALPDNPLFGGAQPRRRPDRRLRPAQPLPLRRRPQNRRAVDRRRRLEQLGRDQLAAGPVRRRPQLRLALLRRRRIASRSTTALDLDLCESLYAAPAGSATAPSSPTATTRRPIPNAAETAAPTPRSPGLAIYPGGDYPARFQDALFFADYQLQLHLGPAAAARRPARPRADRNRRQPDRPDLGPGRRPRRRPLLPRHRRRHRAPARAGDPALRRRLRKRRHRPLVVRPAVT